jgi:cytosine/adenosine deaminase-related metal-dependent hydrolase
MRCFQADIVFPITAPPLENGLVLTDETGLILDILQGDSTTYAGASLTPEKLNGILVPGFVNAHCHLELSWMKDRIQKHTGITGFVKEFVSIRAAINEEQRQEAIAAAEQEMHEKGIVAVGDISNGSSTFGIKAAGRLRYHTFIEVFDLHPGRAEAAFEQALALEASCRKNLPEGAAVSIVPHSPYTVSPQLHNRLADYARQHKSILSIHNQESEAENQLFLNGEGKIKEMYAGMGLDYSWFLHTGKSAPLSYLPHYKALCKMLLVHNTFSTSADMKRAEASVPSNAPLELYWVTCPNANLYIENTLPDYQSMIANGLKLAIGTDSLASNSSLSVLDELIVISSHHPDLDADLLYRWACLNGAESLGMEKELGSFEKGKRPGLVLITNTSGGKPRADAEAVRVI